MIPNRLGGTVTQIPNSSAMQNFAGRQPSEVPYDPIIALDKCIEKSERLLAGQRTNLSNSKETFESATNWDSINGNKIIFETEYIQAKGTYARYDFSQKQLIKAKSQVAKLLTEGRTVEANELSRKAIAKHNEVLKSESNSSQAVGEMCDEQIHALESSERKTQIVADTSVAAAATVATIATGGAAGFVIGTTVGASVGALKNTAGAALEVFAYDKDVLDASIQVLEQTGADTYTAAKASFAAATGAAVAGRFATPVTMAAKAGVASAAGATATVTSLAVNTTEKVIKAEESFQESLKGWGVNEKDIPRLRKEHYARQGLDWNSLAREGAIDLAIGVVSGGQGGVATAARDAVKGGLKQAAITAAEVGGTIVIGATASYVKHGTVNPDTLVEQTAGAALATLAGGAVTSTPTRPSQTPTKEPVTTPAPHETITPVKAVETKTESPAASTGSAKPQEAPATTEAASKTTTQPTKPDLHAFSETLAKEGKEQFPAAFEQMKAIFPEDLRSSLIGRPKESSSIETKLNRANKKDDNKIQSLDDARAEITDLIGTRLVLEDVSPQNIDRVVSSLQKAIDTKKITVTALNNYRGKDTKPYFSHEQVDILVEAIEIKNPEAHINDGKGAIKSSGYTTTQMSIIHEDGTKISLEFKGLKGELQIRGKRLEEASEIEHLFYDAKAGKDLTQGRPELEPVVAEFKQAVQGLTREQMKLYNIYTAQLYRHARLLEDRKPSVEPVFPEGLPTVLSKDSLKSIRERLKH